jgi:hypothetical protein
VGVPCAQRGADEAGPTCFTNAPVRAIRASLHPHSLAIMRTLSFADPMSCSLQAPRPSHTARASSLALPTVKRTVSQIAADMEARDASARQVEWAAHATHAEEGGVVRGCGVCMAEYDRMTHERDRERDRDREVARGLGLGLQGHSGGMGGYQDRGHRSNYATNVRFDSGSPSRWEGRLVERFLVPAKRRSGGCFRCPGRNGDGAIELCFRGHCSAEAYEAREDHARAGAVCRVRCDVSVAAQERGRSSDMLIISKESCILDIS